MGLITYQDKLLQVDDGLTDDPNCCCDGPPPPDPCPPCCVKIKSGTLIDGQIKMFVTSGAFAMEVTITTPSGTRVVCDKDEITVAIDFTVPEGSAGISPDAFATWDAIWRRTAFSPATLGNNSSENRLGHVYWGNDVLSLEYSVDLELNICLLETNPALGLIRVGSAQWTGLVADIELESCEIANCCTKEVECKPCCSYIDPDGWFWNDEAGWWERLVEAIGFSVLVTVEMGDPPLVCVEEGEVVITLTVATKDRILNLDALFDVSMDTGQWPLTAPAGDSPERPAGYKGVVEWKGSAEREFQIRIVPTCSKGSSTLENIVSWAVGIPGAAGTGDSINFMACDTPKGCNCCCPPHCCGDCHFPLADKYCEATPFTGVEIGGATRIVNLKTEITANTPSFCEILDEYGFPVGYESAEQTISQVGESHHRYHCIFKCPNLKTDKCAQSSCSFVVPVKDACPESSTTGVFGLMVSYSGNGIWGIGYAPSGPGYIWWVTGRTSYSGDCNGATASGSFALFGRFYTWTTSFEVIRELVENSPDCPLPDDGGYGYGDGGEEEEEGGE
jgi:hypothetical protein